MIWNSKLCSANSMIVKNYYRYAEFVFFFLTKKIPNFKTNRGSVWFQFAYAHISLSLSVPRQLNSNGKKRPVSFFYFNSIFFFLLRSGCWILWFYADVGFYAENPTAIWSVKNISRIEIDLSAVLHILDKQVAGTFSVFLQENSYFFSSVL